MCCRCAGSCARNLLPPDLEIQTQKTRKGRRGTAELGPSNMAARLLAFQAASTLFLIMLCPLTGNCVATSLITISQQAMWPNKGQLRK